ncbi:hypothetical protein DPEC_G00136860 [Dallia pectoralis]|uniref:Uncharacterized protein n=1 Tax=Dallia pectoralis TaxID=75939 RepID=A0ACC2GLH7_DALPE|nr:hypothetical protein DPEC_G00136860 [Dallia pectoralis]
MSDRCLGNERAATLLPETSPLLPFCLSDLPELSGTKNMSSGVCNFTAPRSSFLSSLCSSYFMSASVFFSGSPLLSLHASLPLRFLRRRGLGRSSFLRHFS